MSAVGAGVGAVGAAEDSASLDAKRPILLRCLYARTVSGNR